MVDVYNDYQAPGEADSFMNPVGSVTNVYGRGGSLRHSGVFSPDNPYLVQLNNAVKNQDKDAWYEKAVNWEADRAKILEQREYEDPSNQVARQRAAGINPDIVAGGSGGSSISSGSSAVQEQTQGQIKPSNAYDNTSLALEGIQAAASMISAFTGVGSTVMQGLSTFKSLPSSIKLAESSAQLASAQANSINALLPSQQSNSELSAVHQRLGVYDSMRQFLTADSTDDDISSVLSTMGIAADSIPSYLQGYRTYEKSPQLQSFHLDWQDKHRAAQARGAVYTSELYSRLTSLSADMEIADGECRYKIINLQHSLASYLEEAGYSELAADGIINQTALSSKNSEFALEQLKYDIKQFRNGVDDIKKAIDKSKKLCEDIVKKYTYLDIFGVVRTRPIPDHEQAIIDAEEARQIQLTTQGSAYVGTVGKHFASIGKNKYLSEGLMSNGLLPSNREMNRGQMYMKNVFEDVLNGGVTSDQLTKSLLSHLPFGIGNFLSEF